MDTSSPRLDAAKSGQSKYEGKPCRRCGGTTRWTINCTCVRCSNIRTKEGVRKRRALIRDLLRENRN